MPSNWLSIDSGFPTFTGTETPQQQIRALHNYLFQLREGLQYSLQNLTTDNFNATALQNMTDEQKSELSEALGTVYDALNEMSANLKKLSSRVTELQSLSGNLTDAEKEIEALKERAEQIEQNATELGKSIREANQEIEALKATEETANQNMAELANQMRAMQETQDGQLETLETMQQELNKISTVLKIDNDGGVTLGTAEKPLRLVGELYINETRYEQGGTE